MSLKATAHTVPGTLQQEVTIDGHHHLLTDEPERLGGDDAGPAPHELLPAALASCVGTTLALYARRREWDLGDVRVDVDYDTTSTPRRCEIVVTLSGDLDDAQVARLSAVADACPVRRAIESGFLFEERLVVQPSSAAQSR